MILSVASGKGGTGKTTVAVNLALALQPDRPVHFLDCDVEEPNAHFFLKPVLEKSREVLKLIPEIDKGRCTYCGRCAEICAYNALAVVKDSVLVFPDLCHGCGGCRLLCPEDAIREVGVRIGVVESGRAGGITFAHGRLDIGQAMSPPLIRAVKEERNAGRVVIIDSPPGTSCPVIESLKGSDFCLLVTEPTPFGLHDLELAAGAAKEMNIPRGVVVNRAFLGGGDGPVRDFCSREGIPVLMTIPFDRRIAEAYSRGETLLDAIPSARQEFRELFERIERTRS
ncbi:MAG: ATP-binding protein [Candidatus Aminicenantes bacterium]|nr:ATP-binding protein [Candidatus Aminicenantes bacterium]